MFIRLRRYFFAGLLITAPLFISITFGLWLIEFVDSRIVPLIPNKYNPNILLNEYFGIDISLPGVGVVFLFLFIIGVGAMTSGLVGKFLIKSNDRIVSKLPIISTVYKGVKQIIEAFAKENSSAYNQAVLVQFPIKGTYAVAFVTGYVPKHFNPDGQEKISVYVPTTPNPTGGYMLLLPKSEVIDLNVGVEEAFKYLISTGIIDKGTPTKN